MWKTQIAHIYSHFFLHFACHIFYVHVIRTIHETQECANMSLQSSIQIKSSHVAMWVIYNFQVCSCAQRKKHLEYQQGVSDQNGWVSD